MLFGTSKGNSRPASNLMEIMYIAHQLGRYMTKAMKSHFEVAKHVIRYLEGKLKARV